MLIFMQSFVCMTNLKWNQDPRLDGGYENVPTVDIHMNQIGLEAAWLEMLRLYVEPLQTRVYTGYYHYVRICVFLKTLQDEGVANRIMEK